MELFEERVTESGLRKAKWLFIWDVLKLFRPSIMKPIAGIKFSQSDMFRNNLKIGYRNLLRNKLHASINIGGLCIGFASCLVIFHFLSHELSYDQFHSNKENIYRINMKMPNGQGGYTSMINTQPALAGGISGPLSQISRITRMRYVNRVLLSRDDTQFYETSGYYADSSFMEIFDFPLINGDRSKVLSEPNSIILSEELAQKYFGVGDPVGQLLDLNGNKTLKVTGLFEPISSNSHIQFDFLISFDTYEVPPGVLADLTSWGWLGFLTYVELTDEADPYQFQSDLDNILKEKTNFAGSPYVSEVQPLADLYMGSGHLKEDPVSGLKSGSKFAIYAVGVVAMLILIVAAFNFMNLTSALYMRRVKEIGLRKILGAGRFRVMEQLLTESILISLISVLLGYALYLIVFPSVSQILEWDFGINSIHQGIVIVTSVAIALIMGIFSVAYPAILLARTKSVSILGRSSTSDFVGGVKLRNALMTLQFGISICLIIGTLVITRQIDYLHNKSLGIDKENVLVIKLLPEDMGRHFEAFKNKLVEHSYVVSVTRSGRSLGSPWPVNSLSTEMNGQLVSQSVQCNWTDVDYFKTLGIPIKEGRSFSREFATDGRQAIVLNEKAVKELGLKDPIGKSVSFWGDRKVIGVVEDFNFSSLHDQVSPAVVVPMFLNVEYMYVRIAPGNIHDKISFIEQQWKEIGTTTPLNITFLDDEVGRFYLQEQKLSSIVQIFSGLAIVLACLGLYALVTILVANKVKEVSIRKVLGATMVQLFSLMSRKYFRLLVVANLIAWPLAYLASKLWLTSFAYRIEIGWYYFMIAGVATFLIALLTVGSQMYRTANTNPADVLRDE